MFSSGEATSKRGILTLKYPIERGYITNWDDIEKFLHHTFYNELRIAPEEHPTIFTEPVLNPQASREKITQIMFETFNVPAFYLIPNALCSLYASGRTSGIVLDSGSATRAVPILSTSNDPKDTSNISNLKIVKSGVKSINIGGEDVTTYLGKMLTEKGFPMTTSAEKETLKDVKASLCFVSQDYVRDCSINEDLFLEGYELPDGQVLPVGYERFRAPEILFDPTLAGHEFPGIHKLVEAAGLAVPAQKRHDVKLWENIVLSGGNTCFPGIGQRLQKEMNELLKFSDAGFSAKVIAPPERPISAWVGTSIFGSLSTMNDLWITKEHYDEIGPTIINSKCNHYLDENSN